MAANRIARVNEVLRRELAGAIGRLRLPSSVLVTVTDVDTAPDLRTARVYLSFLGGREDEQATCRHTVNASRGHLQAEVSRRVTLKFTPQLTFHIDDSAERGVRLVQLIDDVAPGTAPTAPESP
jgi:ribosome-binding factor A